MPVIAMTQEMATLGKDVALGVCEALGLQQVRHEVGDVVAGHGETALMKAARAAGCRTADGDAMVVAVLDVMCDFVGDAWK